MVLPYLVVAYKSQFRAILVISFPLLKCTSESVTDCRKSESVCYGKITPKGCLQLIAVLSHKFSECHIVIVLVSKCCFPFRSIATSGTDLIMCRSTRWHGSLCKVSRPNTIPAKLEMEILPGTVRHDLAERNGMACTFATKFRSAVRKRICKY